MHIQPYKMQDSQPQQWCFVSNIPTIQRVSTEPATHKLQTNSDYPSPSMHLLPSKCISWLSWSSTWVCSREVSFRISVGFKFYFPRKWLLCYRLHKKIHLNWHFKKNQTKPAQSQRQQTTQHFLGTYVPHALFLQVLACFLLQALRDDKWHI